jgi:hypothetical protein
MGRRLSSSRSLKSVEAIDLNRHGGSVNRRYLTPQRPVTRIKITSREFFAGSWQNRKFRLRNGGHSGTISANSLEHL